MTMIRRAGKQSVNFAQVPCDLKFLVIDASRELVAELDLEVLVVDG